MYKDCNEEDTFRKLIMASHVVAIHYGDVLACGLQLHPCIEVSRSGQASCPSQLTLEEYCGGAQ